VKKLVKKEQWIQKTNMKKDALRNYVKNRYGKEGFTNRGTIKVSLLRELASSKNVRKTTKKRAQLALNLRKTKKGKGKKK